MTTTRAKSKKAVLDICPEISNKISTREALSVVETTRQNVLEVFSLPSNRDKLPLVATKAIFSSLAGFSSVKVPSKKHTWVSLSIASIPTKSPKVFNNRPVNKLVFPSIDSTLGAVSTISSKKMIKKTKSLEKWEQSLVSVIVTPNPFVVPNEILDEISIASFSTFRSSPVLEANQSSPVGSLVLGNWADQMETESSSSLVASILVFDATFKIKLAYVKAVFQSVHGFLGAKSVLKDNMKLFCMEFASQQSLKAVFLVEFTSSVHLTTFKIAKSLVVSESISLSAAVTALSMFGSVAHVVLKPAGIWQYVVVYFEKLDSAVSVSNYWSVLMGKDSVRIFPLVNQNKTILSCDMFKAKLIGGWTCFILHLPDSGHHSQFALVTFGSRETPDCRQCFRCQKVGHLAVDCKVSLPLLPKAPKMFKPHFVGFLSYAKTSAFSVMSEFFPLVAFVPFVAVVDPTVGSRLDSLEKQISDLAALVKSIIEPIGSLVALISRLFDNNVVKTVQLEKDLLSIKYASNNFVNLLVGVSKDIVCLRSEVDFGGMNYDDIQATKPSFLSENTVEHVVALWQMSGAKVRSSIKFTRLFLNEFIFDSRNLNDIIEKIHGLELFSPPIVSA
ncbi:hypothetical protein G9A89_023229 [Geosiphon pyriformis]|nr:hypothetical protein G9A89_023229 [Geosiphon pyriformis]